MSLQTSLRDSWDQKLVASGNENIQSYSNFSKTYLGMLTPWLNPPEREVQARASVKPGTSIINMTAGKPDQAVLPFDDLMAAARTAWERSRPAPLEYGNCALLKSEIAKYLTKTRGHRVEADEIFITAGNTGGLKHVMQTYLGPGDIAIVESPLWTFTANLMKQTGAHVISIGMDNEGILVDEVQKQILAAEQDGNRIKMIYVQPVNHNPTGTSMSRSRAEQLLRLAASSSIIIVSDEPYEMYCYEDQPFFLSSLSGGFGVLTVHTFSKTLGTGLRLGYVHASSEWIAPLLWHQRVLANFGWQGSIFLEYAVGELMASGKYEQIVARAKSVYARKIKVFCDALSAYVGRHLACQPRRNGGFFVWMELESLPVDEMSIEMISRGVEARAGWIMHGPGYVGTSSKGPSKACFAFAFVGPSEEDLVEAARRIGAACDAVEARRLKANL